MTNKIDFLAIGDITTDAFIRLNEPSAHCHLDRENLELCVNFGDKIPYESVDVIRAVGNSPNASVSASRLGIKSALVANIGDDQNGKECLESLVNDSVNTEFMTVHKGMKTNYHYVLWYEDDRTILVKHENFSYKLPDIGEPKWIYLSSLGMAAEKFHDEIADYLEKHPSIKLAFQPGTFQINLGYERLERIYRKSDVLACNRKEAGQILRRDGDSVESMLKSLHGMGIKMVLITDGPLGAYFYDGAKLLFMPPYPDPKPPFERTGAGDAYSSTFVSALAMGKSPEEALLMAPINSMSVVQKIGAQRGLLSAEEIDIYLKSAPADYKIKKME